MKSMSQFGMPLIGYEGIAHVTFEEHDAPIESSGYFEAAHYSSGRTSISVVCTDLRRSRRLLRPPEFNCLPVVLIPRPERSPSESPLSP